MKKYRNREKCLGDMLEYVWNLNVSVCGIVPVTVRMKAHYFVGFLEDVHIKRYTEPLSVSCSIHHTLRNFSPKLLFPRMTLKLIQPAQNTLAFFHPTFEKVAASDSWLVWIHSTPQLTKLSVVVHDRSK